MKVKKIDNILVFSKILFTFSDSTFRTTTLEIAEAWTYPHPASSVTLWSPLDLVFFFKEIFSTIVLN